jgi:hypothetical protein
MSRNKVWIFAVAAVLAIGACQWEMPEQVVVRATPEVWIPTGSAVFELEFVDEISEAFSSLVADLGLVGGEKSGGGYDGKPLTLYAELVIDTPTFPDSPPGEASFNAYFDGHIGPIDLTDIFGPLAGKARLAEVPILFWFERVEGDPDPAPEVEVRVSATWTSGGSPTTEYLVGDAGGFGQLAFSQAEAEADPLDLGPVFNEVPEDLELHYEFSADSGVVSRIASVHIRFEIPFALETDPGTFLQLEDDEGNDLLVMDEDLFGRDPADPDEDLAELLESIRGSNATLVLRLVNSSGLGVRLGLVNAADTSIDKYDPANWVLDVNILPDETEQEITVAITPEVVDQLIDGVGGQFIPELLILLPEDFQLNSVWEFGISEGYLRVEVNLDYEVALEDEA